jgi:hypothetical protein
VEVAWGSVLLLFGFDDIFISLCLVIGLLNYGPYGMLAPDQALIACDGCQG